MSDLKYIFQLDDCLDWIIENHFKRVVIQIKKEHLKHSPDISTYLQNNYLKRCPQSQDSLDIYVTQSNTCCVDLLATQHVSNVDAIIHLGNVCLSLPHIKKEQHVQPVLLAFGMSGVTEDKLDHNIDVIMREIEVIKREDKNCHICVLYDPNLLDHTIKLCDDIQNGGISGVDIADLFCPAIHWNTTPKFTSKFKTNLEQDSHQFGQYLLKKPIDQYSCAIYLGERLSIQSILSGPSKVLKINCPHDMSVDKINVSKTLNKRMALVGRLKDQDELRVGVLITNPLPNLDEITKRLKSYAEPRKHMLYFISMIQTIDECKIGNFDLCDAFIVINSCTCSTILESLVFNRPIITELEFKLACGFEAEYGRVLWPCSSDHLSADDMINKRKVSDVALALIHTRNELLERCSQARLNKWSGMDYGAVKASGDGETSESLAIDEGLTGIASTYASEPLKKTGPS